MSKNKVVIIGAGFAGLVAARELQTAGIGMAAVTALILINFNLMMDTEDFFMIWIMPAIILGSGLIGLIWGEILIRRNTMNSAHITGEVAEIGPQPTATV